MSGALDGVKVLDFSQDIQGPYSTVILSDMGADVLKIERRLTGDPTRAVVLEEKLQGVSPEFVSQNRGKRSMTLDLKAERAREIIYRLAERSDVVVNNWRPGVMDRLGLGYEALARRNPRIVYASGSSFGSVGPDAKRPGRDILGQALGGLMERSGYPDDYPLPAGAAIGDHTSGMLLALGILAALLVRERTGVGQRVDVSLYGAIIAMQGWEITEYSLRRTALPKAGRHHPVIRGLWGVFKTADGYLALSGVSDDRWPLFCKVLGISDLAGDPRFQDGWSRRNFSDELVPIVDRLFITRTTSEWVKLLRDADVLCAPVQGYEDILNDPQALENGYIATMNHPILGDIKVVGHPVALSRTPLKIKGPPPELGQHTEEVLLELGYSWDEMVRLRDEGVI